MTGKAIRLSRLLPADGGSVVVAMDHGQTFGPIEGLVDFTAAAERLWEADGVLMAAQMIRFSGSLYLGKGSPAAITRLNWNSIHCEPWGYQQAEIAKTLSVASAVAAGSDVVLAGLTLQSGSEQRDARNVAVFTGLAEEAAALGIPLIGEVFDAHGLRDRGDQFHDYVRRVCRIACELGADAIKTFYTGDRFAEVTEGVPVPVFALGAEKLAREVDALELAYRSVRAGARGVVFGRNVVQARDSTQFLRGLKAVVRGQAIPAEAAAEYGLT